MEFIEIGQCVYLSDKNINVALGCKFTVNKGYFISLFQVVKDDGYKHDTQGFSNIYIPAGKNGQKLVNQGKKTQIIFNRLNYLEDEYIFILNDRDYLNIKYKKIVKSP